MLSDRNPRPLKEFADEIAEIDQAVKGLGHRVAAAHPGRSMAAFQAEWHIRGILYHLRNCFDQYSHFVDEVSARASTGASHIYMYAPNFQQMLFEFYALVNLCRIALDSLSIYLKQVFLRSQHQLPNSIRDVLKGRTNCPVYNALQGQPLLDYLIDLRDCLVHFRSFATSDNAYVTKEGAEDLATVDDEDAFFSAMARAHFRISGDDAIAVNVYLPDSIFAKNSSGKHLVVFTYDEGLSLISMARSFTQLTIGALKGTLEILADTDDPIFAFRRR